MKTRLKQLVVWLSVLCLSAVIFVNMLSILWPALQLKSLYDQMSQVETTGNLTNWPIEVKRTYEELQKYLDMDFKNSNSSYRRWLYESGGNNITGAIRDYILLLVSILLVVDSFWIIKLLKMNGPYLIHHLKKKG